MVTVATTLVAWAATELAQSGRVAVTSLIEFLHDRFRHEQTAHQAIEVALHRPSADTVSGLAGVLERESLRDPSFGAELQARVRKIQASLTESGNVTNTVSGDVAGPVIQARDVHGGIMFGGTTPP
ncbi:hypothetical protein [Micromonospora yangpuensis]|uniref:Uncharacterized protein n=1 Tax=Micromonospora yangpuensis TaxID=683228 RepID=A0A1C6UUA3_9ACTN|nr:hypothetical protein [Micromonospora yangpuensis]SCL57433.1 hypothetical protein GA0070617_3525 [Micromonospora yangpuensis]